MREYVLGVDGGGTKTNVSVADLSGTVFYTFTTGAININGESTENVRNNLRQIFVQEVSAFGGVQGCRSVCIGAAGISNVEAGIFLENTVREAGYTGKLHITGDYQTALYGALGSSNGILLIAGTGSICYGKNTAGEEHRTGGFGYLIDDEGSGYAIGRDILTAVVRAHDGREEKTLLTPMVFEQLGVKTMGEVISFVYHKNTNKRDIAALATHIAEVCAAGDNAACRIVEKCCDELAALVYPVVERLGLERGNLAMAGSILLKEDRIRNGVAARVASKYPGILCRTPDKDAAYGAVLIALEDLEKERMGIPEGRSFSPNT